MDRDSSKKLQAHLTPLCQVDPCEVSASKYTQETQEMPGANQAPNPWPWLNTMRPSHPVVFPAGRKSPISCLHGEPTPCSCGPAQCQRAGIKIVAASTGAKNALAIQWVMNNKIFLLCGHLHAIHPHKSDTFLLQLQYSFQEENSLFSLPSNHARR